MIYVVAHDGGYEGHGLPVLAFQDRDTAMRWASAQTEPFSVVAVPIYPAVPAQPWFMVEVERD
jgi:hypothetical protein